MTKCYSELIENDFSQKKLMYSLNMWLGRAATYLMKNYRHRFLFCWSCLTTYCYQSTVCIIHLSLPWMAIRSIGHMSERWYIKLHQFIFSKFCIPFIQIISSQKSSTWKSICLPLCSLLSALRLSINQVSSAIHAAPRIKFSRMQAFRWISSAACAAVFFIGKEVRDLSSSNWWAFLISPKLL